MLLGDQLLMSPESEELEGRIPGSDLKLLLFLKLVTSGWVALSFLVWAAGIAFTRGLPGPGMGPEQLGGLSPEVYEVLLGLSALFAGLAGIAFLWISWGDDSRDTAGVPRFDHQRKLGLASLVLVDVFGLYHAGVITAGVFGSRSGSAIVGFVVVLVFAVLGAWIVRSRLLRPGAPGYAAGSTVAVLPWLVFIPGNLADDGLLLFLFLPVAVSILVMVDLLLAWPPPPVERAEASDGEGEAADFEVLDASSR
jgi:hypothetical protein